MAPVAALKGSQEVSPNSKSIGKKRNKEPRRFTRGGRIYDSELGHTCHWCRQKTVEHHVFCCKCTNKFCGRCLRNRNGEDIAKEMLENVMWVCPKCRGGCGPGCSNCCNCGPCRMAQGLEPTGFLVNTARAVNFSNVHDFLVHKVTGESPDVIASRKLGRAWTSGGGALVALPTPAECGSKRKSLALTEGPRKQRVVEGLQFNVKRELSLEPLPSQEDLASPTASPSNLQSAGDADVDAAVKGWSFSWDTRPEEEDCAGTLDVKKEDCDPQVSQECGASQEEYSERDYTTTVEINPEDEESEDSATSPEVKEDDCTAPSHFRKEGLPDQESQDFVGIGFESQDCLPSPEREVKREASPEQEELDVCASAPHIKEEVEELEDWTCPREIELEEFREEEWEGCTLAEVVKTEGAPGQVESEVVKTEGAPGRVESDCPFTTRADLDKCTPVVKSNAVISLSDSDSETGQQMIRVQSTPRPRRRSFSRKLRESSTCIPRRGSDLTKRAHRVRNTAQSVSQQCGLPTSFSVNEFQQRLEMVLKEPFCEQELKKKMELVTDRKPMEKERQMRQRAISFHSSQQGLSYLDHYPGFADKLSAASGDEEKLTLLRGFFFWIEHLMLQGAFAPWTKAPESKSDSDDCMEIGPDCQLVCERCPTETKSNPGRRVRRSLKYPAKRDQLQTLHKKSANVRVKAESEVPRPIIFV